MLSIEPKYFLRKRKDNSKNKTQTIEDKLISSDYDLEKIKMNYFKIDLSSKSNNKSKNKNNNNKNKNKKEEKNKIFNISFIDLAISNFEQGFYKLSLGYAFKSLENENCISKANYIILLSYLKMYDIVSAEKFLENKKNKKLKLLLENKKEELISKSNEFKDYPLYIFFFFFLYKNNSYFPNFKIYLNMKRLYQYQKNV